MQFKRVTRANIVSVEGKLCLELPNELISHMGIFSSDSLDIALGSWNIMLWKSPETEIPQTYRMSSISYLKGMSR